MQNDKVFISMQTIRKNFIHNKQVVDPNAVIIEMHQLIDQFV